MNIKTILTYLAVGLVMLILGGLSGWYLFLRTKKQETSAVDAARGLNATLPSFIGDAGSTASNIAQSIQSLVSPQQKETSSSNDTSSRLWHADKTPVAGAAWQTDASSTRMMYFVERAGGNLFVANVTDRTVVRKTATLFPKTYEALVTPTGRALLRSLNATGTISTFAGVMSSTTVADKTSDSSMAPLSLDGASLEPGIMRIALDSVHATYFYLAQVGNKTVGTLVQWANPKAKPLQVFSSPVSGWIPYLTTDGRIILATTPADSLNGYAYQLQKDGSLTPLIRRVSGLTIVPHDTRAEILYSSVSAQGPKLFVLHSVGSSTPLSLNTIADKCVWAHYSEVVGVSGIEISAASTTSTGSTTPSLRATPPKRGIKAKTPPSHLIAYCAVPSKAVEAGFLGNWLRGATHTADSWWKVDVTAGSSTLIYSPATDNLEVDVEKPLMSEDDTNIAFINRRDQSLWVLRVVQ